MNAYKKLASNSLVFAVGTLGSRIISFLLLPLYTHYLTTGEYGTVDLIITTVNMLIPLVSLSAYDAVLRFTMDKNEKPEVILTNSLLIGLGGFFIALLFYPVLSYFNVLDNNLMYLYIILFVQLVERIFAQYTRAIGEIKIFAVNGIILTFTTGLFNILFIVFFGLGVIGYYWALILSYVVSTIFLLSTTKSYQDLRPSNRDKHTTKKLVAYAAPLIPNSLMWWLINASSRYFILGFIGLSANGLFAVASRIPSILNIFYQVFNQAWQLSAIEEYENQEDEQFYTNVFSYLSTFLFLGASGIILFIKLVFGLLFSDAYFSAWIVVPFLLLGFVFSSLSSYLGSNYVAAKQTKGVLKTSVYGGILSVLLNFLLIPTYGIIGAGLSSMASFFLIFLIRYFDTRKYIFLVVDWKRMFVNVLIILVQVSFMTFGLSIGLELISGIVSFSALLLVNRSRLKVFLELFKKIMNKKRVSKKD